MAQDALNTAVELKGIPTTRQCVTSTLKLIGGQQYRPALHTEVCVWHKWKWCVWERRTDRVWYMSKSPVIWGLQVQRAIT